MGLWTLTILPTNWLSGSKCGSPRKNVPSWHASPNVASVKARVMGRRIGPSLSHPSRRRTLRLCGDGQPGRSAGGVRVGMEPDPVTLLVPRGRAAILLLVIFAASGPLGRTGTFCWAGSTEAYGDLPLSFEANRGQSNPQVKFLSHGKGYTLFLTPTEGVLVLTNGSPGAAENFARPEQSKPGQETVLRIKLLGAHGAPPDDRTG